MTRVMENGRLQAEDASWRWLRNYWLLVGVYAVGMAAYLWLTRANAVPVAERGGPADPAVFMTARELAVSEVYSAERNWLFLLAFPWEWGVYLVLLFSGWVGRMEAAWSARGVPWALRVMFMTGLAHGAAFGSWLPVRYLGYRLSSHYGISTQSLGGWVRDKLVEFGTGAALLCLVAVVAFWVIRRGGRWPVKLWLLSIPFTIFLMYLQPVVLDPLYNQFSRLSDPVLEQKILTLADQADVPTDRVYVADMSTKTNALNAYVNGIGGSLRIVLWDTLFRMEEPEMMLIVAHEMGHYVMRHLEWSAIGAVGSSLALLVAGALALRWLLRRYGAMWGVRELMSPGAVPAALLVVSVLSFAALPVENAVSRRAEAAADRYAMELVGSADGAIRMHQKLAKATYDQVNPPLLVRLFRGSHPTDLDRILEAQAFERRNARDKE